MFLGSSMLQFIISVVGVLVFAGLTAYDTQRLKNDYIYGYASQGGEIAEKAAISGVGETAYTRGTTKSGLALQLEASLKAIESKLSTGAEMLLYSVNAITSGSTESQGEVTIRLQQGGRVVNGVGADPDIVVASAKAYINALNKLHSNLERLNPQL